MVGSDRIVFINFVPGSFGSFLLQCLSHSKSVFLHNSEDIFFDNTGAAHHNITHFLENFHHGDLFVKWTKMSNDDKIKYIEDSWNPPQEFIDSELYYIHRLVIPRYTQILKKHIPDAKYIKITFPNQYTTYVLEMINKKMEYKDRHPRFVQSLRDNSIIDDVYNFDVSHFIEGTFLSEFNKLCEWLNFEKVDVSKQYENFKRANGLNK